MAVYSHSRVSCFENCPYHYKLKYVDRVKADVVNTVEAFMGDLVHRTLEHLYKLKKFKKRVAKASLLKFYRELWAREFSDDILIVKAGASQGGSGKGVGGSKTGKGMGLTGENYRKMGEGFISDYFDRMRPFDQLRILGLETTDRMKLPDGNSWHVRIDKLACDGEGNYFVMDYKTNARMKYQEEADNDRQLALYSVWVREKFSDVKSVKLVWHMLAFDKDVVSERSDEEVSKLVDEVCLKIREIESAEEFPRKESGLCNYCEYRSMCPSFKHEVELKEGGGLAISGEPLAVSSEDGLKLVDEFADVKGRLSELKKRSVELRGKLGDYAKEFGVDVIYGTSDCAKMKEVEKIVLPSDSVERGRFVSLLKEKGLWEEYSMVCYSKINSSVISGDCDSEIKDMCEVVRDFRVSLKKRKGDG